MICETRVFLIPQLHIKSLIPDFINHLAHLIKLLCRRAKSNGRKIGDRILQDAEEMVSSPFDNRCCPEYIGIYQKLSNEFML